MRDVDRIDKILELVLEIWRAEPDLRLGQLIQNAVRLKEPDPIDIHTVEDDTLRKGLRGYLELIKNKQH